MQPTAPVKQDDFYSQQIPVSQSASLIATVQGRRVLVSSWGALTQSMAFFGSTTVELHHDRLVEYSTGMIGSRECHMPITEIDSAELVTAHNPIWLVLGLMTVLIGIGIIFLVMFFFMKNRFLLFKSRSNFISVGVAGTEDIYREFMFRVLEQTNQFKLQG